MDRPVTLINFFTVAPDIQQPLIELLKEITERSVRHAPGFLSARLHRSLDGRPYLERALAMAKFEPGMYEVVETFVPPGAAH